MSIIVSSFIHNIDGRDDFAPGGSDARSHWISVLTEIYNQLLGYLIVETDLRASRLRGRVSASTGLNMVLSCGVVSQRSCSFLVEQDFSFGEQGWGKIESQSCLGKRNFRLGKLATCSISQGVEKISEVCEDNRME